VVLYKHKGKLILLNGGDMMKFSFSTLGCPGWSWEDMLVTAKDLGFDGIEMRGIENELYVPNAKPFRSANIRSTIERLSKLKLEIPCLTSSCYLFDKSNIEMVLKEGREYIDLAQKLGTPFVRVLGDSSPEPGDGVDADFVAKNLSALAEYGSVKSVKILIETNGIFSNSDEMLKLLKMADNPNIGVLWDIHHPFRYAGEHVEKTYNTLKEYIQFIHIKDSLILDGKVIYKILGCGDVPVAEAISLLRNSGYNGYVSLEWVKRWCIELEEPGIVFSHFINHVKTLA
jgi:sugar phosphate isomerase/epimerase